jgi:hypothetical protein
MPKRRSQRKNAGKPLIFKIVSWSSKSPLKLASEHNRIRAADKIKKGRINNQETRNDLKGKHPRHPNPIRRMRPRRLPLSGSCRTEILRRLLREYGRRRYLQLRACRMQAPCKKRPVACSTGDCFKGYSVGRPGRRIRPVGPPYNRLQGEKPMQVTYEQAV